MPGVVAVCVDVLVVAKVLGGRRVERVHLKGIDCLARGVDLTREDGRQRVGAVGAGGGHEQHTLDVGELLEPPKVQRRGGVDNNHAVVEVVIDVLENLKLRRVGLEVGLGLVLLA